MGGFIAARALLLCTPGQECHKHSLLQELAVSAFGIFLLGTGIGFVGAGFSRFELHESNIVTVNLFWRKQLIPFDKIATVEAGYSGLSIRSWRSETRVAYALQKPNISALRGADTEADLVARKVMRSVRAARNGDD